MAWLGLAPGLAPGLAVCVWGDVGRGGQRRATANRPHSIAFPLCGPRAPPSCGAVFFSQPAREGKAAASYKRDAGGGAGKWVELNQACVEVGRVPA